MTLQPGRQLLAGGQRVPIGKRALDIISVLAEAGGEIVTKDELFDEVWPGLTVEENALQVHIVALRKALGIEAERLETIRGVGYRLVQDPAEAETPETTLNRDQEEFSPRPFSGKTGSTDVVKPSGTGPLPWAARHWVLASFAVVAGMLLLAWTFFGRDLGLRPQERIPVVVRSLKANGSGDQAEAALAGGITDELISRLRRIPELRVATAIPGQPIPGDEFRGAYIVDGNVGSNQGRLRVVVRLSASTGEVVWSQRLDKGISDLFSMQEEIASSIAAALSVSFDVGANSREFGGTDNPEAFAEYMQYWAHALDFDQSVPLRHLERAVELDPDFGKAISTLTLSYGNRIASADTIQQAETLLGRMDAASARTLEADPDLWFSQAARGWYFLSKHDFGAAEKQMERVALLDPGNDVDLPLHLATYSIHMGRVKQGASIRAKRELIDPIYHNDPWKIFDLMMQGDNKGAIELFDKLRQNEVPNLEAFVFSTYLAYLLSGREAEAESFAQGYPFSHGLEEIRSSGALPDMPPGELRKWAAERYGGNQVGIISTAIFAGYEGHDRLAVELLRIAYERPGGFVLLLLWSPALADARKTDEFERFVADLGLVAVWRESGDWGDYCRPVSNTEIACT